MPVAAALKVLVADDQGTMRTLVRAGLKELGIQHIEDAVDGEDAFRKLLQAPYHLVLSDYNMPKMDGLALLRAIRATDATKKLGFIMLTGRSDSELVQKAVQFGVNNYLVKPFNVTTLRAKIEGVFGALT